jgi:hypothetical protein
MKNKYGPSYKERMLNDTLRTTLYYIDILNRQYNLTTANNNGLSEKDRTFQINMYTNIITMLNDLIHPCHGYASTIYDKEAVTQLVENQKRAFASSLVNPCKCDDCKSRGYESEEWNKPRDTSVDMEAVADAVKRATHTDKNTSTN